MPITLDGTTGITSPAIDLTTPLVVADGGTGTNTLTANNVILGNGTSAVAFVAPGSNGNLLTSNGTTWTSAAAAGGQIQNQVFAAPGTWTKPASCTQVRVTVAGGGAGAWAPTNSDTATPGSTSSFGPAVSATGGTKAGPGTPGTPGAGTVSVGTNIRTYISITGGTVGTVLGGNSPVSGTTPATTAYSITGNFAAGQGGVTPGGTSGGAGGLAVAIVPVSAPVVVTVGAGGNGSPTGQGGIGGAVLVEFVG